MDNNKAKLSNLKYYPKMERLMKIQEQLTNSKVIQDAKVNNKKYESYTAINPIV